MNVRFLLTRFLLCFLIVIASDSLELTTAAASVPVGTIAYVRPNQPDGDEIHLIEPDGSGDRQIFSTGRPISKYLKEIGRLDWKPDATELAFSSRHEIGCSLYEEDIYAIRPDGKNYRRISGPPACGAGAGRPTGTVILPVENHSKMMGPFTIYFEGAPGPFEIALSPGGYTELTFEDVVDFGDQEQFAVWMYSNARSIYPGAKVDVIAGATVEAGTLVVSGGFEHFGYAWPNYLPDGSAVATIFHESDLYLTPSNNTEMGLAGTKLTFDMTIAADHLAWGPTPDLADVFLFHGWTMDEDYNTRFPIMMGHRDDNKGFMLVDVDPTMLGNHLLGLTWLPDGSGFLYSVSELVGYNFGANIWEYSFATGLSKRVTNVPYGFAREISVSPDGQKIVFELQPSGDWFDVNPKIDLWMVNRDGSGLGEFIEGARSPAWSPQSLPRIVYSYIPMLKR